MAPPEGVLITGAAGFIGYHLARRYLADGYTVVGLDNFSPYYDVQLKRDRVEQLRAERAFQFVELDITARDALPQLLQTEHCDLVLHMAAQPGVRYSLVNPQAYIDSNLVGFGNLLEACRHTPPRHLVFASSSSVYGANTRTPFSVHANADHPLSLYAATKKANELMAHVYAHLYRLPCTGLRFFTVYGPWGRPDMSLTLFTRAILAGQAIEVFNEGKMERDFTYIDDIVEGVVRLARAVPTPDPVWSGNAPDPATSTAPYRLYNIGNHQPVSLLRLIALLESTLERKAITTFLPMQPGDVQSTIADVDDLTETIDFHPTTSIEIGVQRFVAWYKKYYHVGRN